MKSRRATLPPQARMIRCETPGLIPETENDMSFEEYWEVIQTRICRKCGDGDGKGGCAISRSGKCAIREYFPLIVNAVNRVSSDRVKDYVSELKGIVCAQCANETADGRCALRVGAGCALDRHFPLIIEAIDEVNQRLHV